MKAELNVALPLALLLAAPAGAQDWEYRVAPYLWLPTLSTTLDVGPNPPVGDSKSILDILQGAFLIAGEARNGRWSVPVEFNYLKLGDDVSLAQLGTVGSWSLDGVMASVSGAYAFHDTDRARVEALAGLRAWDLDVSTTVAGLTADVNASWVDPIVGARFDLALNERWRLSGLADVGGFGVGSDFQWEVQAQLGWQISDLVDLTGGYRHMHVDFDDAGTVVDLELSGPFIAVGFNF